jgi:hypothetical protein
MSIINLKAIKIAVNKPSRVISIKLNLNITVSPRTKNIFRTIVNKIIKKIGRKPFKTARGLILETVKHVNNINNINKYPKTPRAMNKAVIYTIVSINFVRGSNL